MITEKPLGIIEICQVASQENNWRGYKITEIVLGPNVVSTNHEITGLLLGDIVKIIKDTLPLDFIKLENNGALNKALAQAQRLDNGRGITFIQEGRYPVTDPRKL